MVAMVKVCKCGGREGGRAGEGKVDKVGKKGKEGRKERKRGIKRKVVPKSNKWVTAIAKV